MKRWSIITFALMFLFLSATAVWADDDDPPGRVARLQYTSGSVSIQPQGEQDWVAAVLNRPLTNTDNVWTDKDSRAELSVGTGTLRMDGESSLTLTNINDRTVQVELHQGTLSLHIRKLYDGELYEIDTPNLAFTIQKSGDYRFDVEPEGDATTVTVWKGEGDATGEGPSVRVKGNQRVRFTGGTSLVHQAYVPPTMDGFDDWGQVRDRRLDKSVSAQYVSRDVIGYEDLDDYGSWETVPTYGPIWVPRHVVAGWAPYRYGHWVYVRPWGWTWVDDASWGFAPFHYGRWVYYNNYWGWAPGPVYVRPVYAPALVAWFGGGNWGVGLGFGGGPAYGWCPLGYGDPFIPWYRGSRNYFRNVNVHNTRITNITYVTNNYYNNRNGKPWQYANLRSPNGRTFVSERTLVGSHQVSRGILKVNDNDFARAPRGQVDLKPTRSSLLGSRAGRPTAIPPQRTFDRPVVTKMRPPARPAGDTPLRTGGMYPGRANDNNNSSPRPGASADANGRRTGGSYPGRAQNENNNVPRPGSNAGIPQRSNDGSNDRRTGGSYPGRTQAEPNRPSVPRPGSGPAENRPQNDGANDNRRTGGLDPRTAEPNNSVPRPGRIANENSQQRLNAQPTSPRPERVATENPQQRLNSDSNSGNRNNNVPHPPERQNTPSAQPDRTPQRFGSQPSTPHTESHPQTTPAPSRNASPPPQRSGPPDGGRSGGGEPRNNFTRSPRGGRSMNVPRPSGPVLPASNRSVDYRASQGARSSAFSGRGQMERQSSRAYASPNYGSSYSRSYSSSPRSSPSFSGRSSSRSSGGSFSSRGSGSFGGGFRGGSMSRGGGGGSSHGGGGMSRRGH